MGVGAWLGGAMVTAYDLRSRCRGFNFQPFHHQVTTLGKVVHTHLPLSPSSITTSMTTTPSRLPTTAAAAHPNKTAPFLWACGMDERLPRHFQSPTYVDPRAAQGLEMPPRTSTSHLASDPKCRPPSTQPRTQLSMATCPGQRTMEATRGNGYAPAWGLLMMMMMILIMHNIYAAIFKFILINIGLRLGCSIKLHMFSFLLPGARIPHFCSQESKFLRAKVPFMGNGGYIIIDALSHNSGTYSPE